MSLTAAIRMLQAEVDAYGQGTPRAPKEGYPDWYLLRAKSLALSALKRADQLALEASPAGAERYFSACGKLFKNESDGDKTDAAA